MKALIIVDIQNDFLPGGALAVPEGDAVIPVVNGLQKSYDLVAATQDWHPMDHSSFASNHHAAEPFQTMEINGRSQTVWPDHCIWETGGAEIARDLNTSRISAIFRKGIDSHIDSYSAFYDLGRERSTGLGDWLKGLGVNEVHIAGLAAEVCVAYTANDACDLGFRTVLIQDATQPLDKSAFAEFRERLEKKGVEFVASSDLS